MALLDDLVARLRAEPILRDISILENQVIDDETFHFKVRATVNPANLQIRFLSDKSFNRYSFQLYSDRPLLRWDNTPHYPNLINFPHHFHDEKNFVSASTLTGNLLGDLELVLIDVRRFISALRLADNET